MEQRNKPPDGQLKCYVCGWEVFTVWYRASEGPVLVHGNLVVPKVQEPQVNTLLCARCNTLHYISDRGWYIGNTSARWNEEKQELEFPTLRVATPVRKVRSEEEELKVMLRKLTPEALKKVLG